MRNTSQIHHDTWGDDEELLQDLSGTPSLIEQYAEEDVVTQALEVPGPEPIVELAARRLRLTSALRAGWRERAPGGKPRALPPIPAPAPTTAAALAHPPVGAPDPGEAPTEPSMRVKRAVMVMSALAMLGVFLTMYVLSSGRDAQPEPDVDARPRPTRAVPAAEANTDGVLAKGGPWPR